MPQPRLNLLIVCPDVCFSLDLDAWINEPPPPSSESEEEEEAEATNPVADIFIKTSEPKSNPEPTEEQLKKVGLKYALMIIFYLLVK